MAVKPAKAPSRHADKRRPMGLFWLGFVCIALAFTLMAMRNYQNYISWQNVQRMVDAPEVFRTLHERFPKIVPAPELPLERADVPLHPHDPAIGPVDAPVRIVVFNDPGCPACLSVSRQVLELRRLHGDKVRIVYKFFPTGKGSGSMDAALFGQMAHKKGLFWVFHDRLVEAGKADTDMYSSLLEKIGIPLAEQREMLKAESEFLVRRVDAHVADARALGLDTAPVVYVNAYRLGQERLPLDGLSGYVQRLLDGKSILQPSGG